MNISIEALLDYLECPTRYKYRYIDRIDTASIQRAANANSLEETFDKEIHKIAYHVFNYIQDGKYPSEYLLRQKWGKTWCKNKTVDDLMGESFELVNNARFNPMKRLERQGLKAIENLHPHFKANPGTPILVGKRVDVKVGRHVIGVTLDLVRAVTDEGEEKIELIDFKTGIKTRNHWDSVPLNLHVNHDIEMTAASLAFRQLTGEKEDRIVYYDMVNNREYATRREESHFKTLENILDNVEKALGAEVFYPVMIDRCNECPFLAHCNKNKGS
jgi:hypothetical protein